MTLIECVPNISEGRNEGTIDAVCTAIAEHAKLLHVDVGPAANRTVLTFAASTGQLSKAVFSLYRTCLSRIDMRQHSGIHPRLGAVDVCPLVPLQQTPRETVIDFSRELATEIASNFDLPVFLYEQSAKQEAPKNLAQIRKGEFEGLAEKLRLSEWKPDYGPSYPHPSAGATVIGARDFLIAFNVNLETKDVSVAKAIAKNIRASNSGLPGVKAIGWFVEEYNCTQVSINLTDFFQTGLYEVFSEIAKQAQNHHTSTRGSELVGLVPLEAMLDAGIKFGGTGDERTLINHAAIALGLSSVKPFNPLTAIVEYRL